ncbi:MAG: M15 family metallopeptidase, partial [Nitriliruptorales bacterium]
TASVAPAPIPKPDVQVLLVWTSGGLPAAFADRVAELPGVEQTTVVRGDRVDLVGSTTAEGKAVDAPGRGWMIPLDALAVDPASYAAFLPASARETVADLEAGEALLGETSARLRAVDVGGRLRLTDGNEVTVAGVLPDTLVGGAELVVPVAGADAVGVTTERFVLVTYRGDRGGVEVALREAAPDGTAVRVRGPGETPYLRHGDAVLPQALLKDVFGEFAYRRPDGGRDFVQDPDWAAENIVTADVPILGSVRCHRGIVKALKGALGELEARGLAHLVDPDAYAGCWNPRLISEGGSVSRHAWGIGFDVNADANPTGQGSGQDRRLVEVMQRWGFTWGGFWLVPDPMHFEYLEPPDEIALKVPTG